MEAVLAFVFDNWEALALIVFVIASLILCVVLYFIGGFEKVRPWAYDAICAAENMFLHGENEKKFEYYFDCVYQKLPIFIQFFMSKNAIAKKLEEWYIQVKDLLDNGVMDDSAKIGEAKDIE